MKDFFSIKNLKMFLGLTTGYIIYDYFAHDEIDWLRSIGSAIIAIVIIAVFFNKEKKEE
jgi:uncharacterized membrane protein